METPKIYVLYFLNFFILFMQCSSHNISCIESERKALIEIKRSLIDESSCLASWVGEDCCSWDGVTCHKTNGHVDGLDFFSLKCYGQDPYPVLRGEINPSLSNLTNLREFILWRSNVNGSIPTSIGRLSMLETLVLADNTLTGSIPTSIGRLSMLESLDLSYNKLAGVVSELLFVELTRLKELSLGGNRLALNVSSTWVPPFQLRVLDLDSIKLGPTFPPWLQTQSNIQNMFLKNTSISDSIPNWFERVLFTMKILDLSENEIGGNLPEFPPTMEVIFLSSNKFTSIPKCLPRCLIDLSNNLLQGHFPAICASQQTGMSLGLYLSNNNLSGPIPEYLCSAYPYMVDLSSNQFQGEIPLCLTNSTFLLSLDLSNNNLHGQIPTLSDSLISIHLNNNFFHGKLPSSLHNSTLLKILDLGRNEIDDILPPWLGELSSLHFLNLESNRFHGDIPSNLCTLSSLQVLNLAQNSVTGRIPLCFSNLTNMAVREWDRPGYVSYIDANVKGIGLHYTKNLQYLVSIDISSNNMVGEIPNGLGDLVALTNLNLSSNNFHGKIPEKICNLRSLESLDLSINKLYGPIPPNLSNLNFLERLNLSYNQLSGRIPKDNHLETLFSDPSIYAGNTQLCGEPILKSCSDDKSKSFGNVGQIIDHDEDDSDMWFYAVVGSGMLTGFVGSLCFKWAWMHQFFSFIAKVVLLRKKFHKRSQEIELS